MFDADTRGHKNHVHQVVKQTTYRPGQSAVPGRVYYMWPYLR